MIHGLIRNDDKTSSSNDLGLNKKGDTLCLCPKVYNEGHPTFLPEYEMPSSIDAIVFIEEI